LLDRSLSELKEFVNYIEQTSDETQQGQQIQASLHRIDNNNTFDQLWIALIFYNIYYPTYSQTVSAYLYIFVQR